jgi:cell fate regulator YaaT (PSP1 superfamily)
MINTAKITGPCGRLLCCLKYEYEFYVEALKNIPDEGSTIKYEGKTAKVITVNVFLSRVTIYTEDGDTISLPFEYFRSGDKNVEDNDNNRFDISNIRNRDVSNGES